MVQEVQRARLIVMVRLDVPLPLAVAFMPYFYSKLSVLLGHHQLRTDQHMPLLFLLISFYALYYTQSHGSYIYSRTSLILFQYVNLAALCTFESRSMQSFASFRLQLVQVRNSLIAATGLPART